MVVEEVMTRNPLTVDAAAPIRTVMTALGQNDVRHIPVLDGGELVGIVSDRDLREYSAPAVLAFEHPDEIRRLLERPISTLMTGDVLYVHPETELDEVVDMLVEQKVGAIPVVSTSTQDLVGIVSYVDVLRAARDLF
jgi:acetoin utilization protein AcuB